jgi:GT2 family glycosyltransferase
MPFAGTAAQARTAIASLATLALGLGDKDELILADNCGAALSQGRPAWPARVRVIDARGERSPAHARNAGAAASGDDAEWILFVDADAVVPPGLLDRYFAEPIEDDVGAVAGAIAAAPLGPSAGVAARYGAYKNFLNAEAHLAHPFMPRAAAANLLVRRAAFDAVGGFFEGLRAAEDTDFSWRLQRAGWTLVGRPEAAVEHRYRDSLPALRRQWRGYAAGRAWLRRRYDGFEPQPALLRAARKAMGGTSDTAGGHPRSVEQRRGDDARQLTAPMTPWDRVGFGAVDVILGLDELIGFALSNRPPVVRSMEPGARRVVVAHRFPDAEADVLAAGNPADPGPVRIEAAARAERTAPTSAGVTIVYREDDGPFDRAHALAALAARHPGRVLMASARDRNAPSLVRLAPAACRLLAGPAATLSPSSTDPLVQAAARRLGRLGGRESSRRDRWREMLTRRAQSSNRIPAAGDHEPKER